MTSLLAEKLISIAKPQLGPDLSLFQHASASVNAAAEVERLHGIPVVPVRTGRCGLEQSRERLSRGLVRGGTSENPYRPVTEQCPVVWATFAMQS